jgi:DNA-binding transcriptional ArsR family regulator
MELDSLVRVYRALGDGTRLRLVRLLADLEPGGALCVNALVAELGVSQPAVSQHLGVLRAADLVIGERRGYHVHYRLKPAGLAAYRRETLGLLGKQFMESPADTGPQGGRARERPACRAEHPHDEGRATVARTGRRRPS